MSTVIFLDKDGTLIDDLPYNVDPGRIRLAAGAHEALKMWADVGWPIAIITNQSGVALGYFTLEELGAVADHVESAVREAGATWGGFYACPHLREGVNEYAVDCDCRKPAPGLIREASERLGVDPRTAGSSGTPGWTWPPVERSGAGRSLSGANGATGRHTRRKRARTTPSRIWLQPQRSRSPTSPSPTASPIGVRSSRPAGRTARDSGGGRPRSRR